MPWLLTSFKKICLCMVARDDKQHALSCAALQPAQCMWACELMHSSMQTE